MTKTSFISQKSEKLEQKRNYYDSYIEFFKYELSNKRQKKIDKFIKENPQGDVKEYEDILVNEDNIKIEKKIRKFQLKHEKEVRIAEKTNKNEVKRIWEIDFVRGVIIIGMLIDHFIGDFWMVTRAFSIHKANDFFTNMYSFSVSYWDHPARVAVRLLGVMLLLVLSGISASFSRNSLKHSIYILIVGGLMSAVFGISAAIMKDFTFNVIIGAVTCIGLCLFIYSLFKIIFHSLHWDKAYKWFSLAVGLGILIMWGFLSYNNPDRTNDPNWNGFWYIYNNYVNCIHNIGTPSDLRNNFWKMLIGLNYYGSDWLPLFPYLGYMFIGGFIGQTVYKNKESLLHFIKSKTEISTNQKVNHHTRGITFFGKHSIWFYIFHQPVYILIILIIALIMGCKISL